jgi:S1-C subfamily serine protease
MGLVESYASVRKSIVAFIPRYSRRRSDEPPAPFPTILGTGFVVREDGLIATNDHVVQLAKRIPTPPDAPADVWPVTAVLFKPVEEGMFEIPLEVVGAAVIGDDPTQEVDYGGKPDVALVHVRVSELPAVSLDLAEDLQEGTELATAGFPMGTDALVAPGWLHQISPTLQRGVVSALLPFPDPNYHGFTINVMVQGGASGSPVFRVDTGAVVGVLHASLVDKGKTSGNHDYRVPTNISYVAPARYIQQGLDALDSNPEFGPAPGEGKALDDQSEVD